MMLAVEGVSYTGNGSGNDERRVRATEVGVGAGATVGGAKYGINAFKRFKLNKVGDVVQLSGKTTQAIRDAANVGKKSKTLWNRMLMNAKTYKESIINWGKSLKVAKWMKPIFESKAFAKVSAAIGGVTAVFVFISGIGEMGNTFSKLANKGD